MSVKKAAAAIMAVAMLGAAMNVTPAAISSGTDKPQITADTSNMEGVINPAQYEALSESEKEYYTKVTIGGDVYFLAGSDIENGGAMFDYGTYYVLNDTMIYIAAFNEYYVGHDIYVNGYKLEVQQSGGDKANFGGVYYVSSYEEELDITMKERELTDEEKANYVPVVLSPGVYMVKNLNYDEQLGGGDESLLFDVYTGCYARKGDWYYIGARTEDYLGNNIFLNGSILEVYMSGDGTNYGTYYQVKDTDTELNISLSESSYGNGVINEWEYEALTADQKSEYFKVNISGPVLVSAGTSADRGAYTFPLKSGLYVWKNEPSFDALWIGVEPSMFDSVSHVYVNSTDIRSLLLLNGDSSCYVYDYDISDYADDEITIKAVTESTGNDDNTGSGNNPSDPGNDDNTGGDDNTDEPDNDDNTGGDDNTGNSGNDGNTDNSDNSGNSGNSGDTGSSDNIGGSGNNESTGNSGSSGSNNSSSPLEAILPMYESGGTGYAGVPTVSAPTAVQAPAAAKVASGVKSSGKKDITVTAPEEGITKDILSAFRSNKKAQKLTVKYSSSLRIEISKDNISGEPADLDFSGGGKFLSSKQISSFSQLSNSEKVIQLNFTNDGDFGGIDKVTVKSYAGTKLSGKTAVVYEYKNGKLVKAGGGKISAAGYVSFETNHYGKYIISVS